MEKLRIPETLQARLSRAGGQNLLSMTLMEMEQWRADELNKRPGTLTDFDCPDCMNRGCFYHVDDAGCLYSEECACMVKRRSIRRMRRSGLGEMLGRYTLERWSEEEPWQRRAAQMVRQYAENPDGWFVMAGCVGAGKTHLCTALCSLLMERGMDVRYMLWRDICVRAKAVVNDEEEYQSIVRPLKQVKVLYIDDLFKTKKGQEPSVGDVNLAFEIINARYNDRNLLTVISTEYTAENLVSVDEAVGSRIYERSKRYYLPLTNAKNWRLK